MYTAYQFLEVHNGYRICKEKDTGFLQRIQQGVLLSLVEMDLMTPMQYRYASEILAEQFGREGKTQI